MSNTPSWKATACVLCENNCGIEVKVSENGQRIEKSVAIQSIPPPKDISAKKQAKLTTIKTALTGYSFL